MDECHKLFKDFNDGCKNFYGTPILSMNFHLLIYLKKNIEDFSAPHAHWLFAFGRFNGLLGRYKNNNHNIELTYMRTYLRNAHIIWRKTGEARDDTPFANLN